MAEDLIDSHVSLEQAQKAINALHKHAKKRQEEREETELLPGKEQNVWLVVGVKKIYPEGKLKPFKM
jgi:ribosome biogenesis protein UTP30